MGDFVEVVVIEIGVVGRLGVGVDRMSVGLDRYGSLNSRGLSSRGLDNRGDDGGRVGYNVDSGGSGNRSRGVGGSVGDSGGRGNDGGGVLSNGSEVGGESGIGDGVVVEGVVDVEVDISVGGSVEGSIFDILGKDSVGISDFNVEVLRVVLGVVEVVVGVKGDDFVVKDVLVGMDVGGNFDYLVVVVVNEDIGSLLVRGLGIVDKISFGDFEEFESSFFNFVVVSVIV